MSTPGYIPGPLSTSQLQELEYATFSGVLPLNATNSALANSLVAKQSAGKLYGVTATNTKATAQFVQVFDARALPADGSVPLIAFSVPAGNAVGVYFGSVGRAFEQGIVVCNSSTQGSKTIGSADCIFDAQFV